MSSRIGHTLALVGAFLLATFGSRTVGAICLVFVPFVSFVYQSLRLKGAGYERFYKGNNRCILYMGHALAVAVFMSRWSADELFLQLLFAATLLGVVLHFWAFSTFSRLDARNLPFLLAKHPHRYVRHIKRLSQHKKSTCTNYWMAEFLVSVPALCVTWTVYPGKLWVYPVLAAVCLVSVGGRHLYIVRRIKVHADSGVYHQRLVRAVFRLQPEVVLHFGGPGAHFYQVTMWLDVLKALDQRVLLVVRRKCAVPFAAKADIPSLFVHSERDIERLIPSSVRVALYPGNTSNNQAFVRLPQVRSVFIGHGDSDKAASANNVSRMYHSVFVAGDAGIERYEKQKVGIDRRTFEIVGRPQLDAVAQARERSVDEFSILYAPTWEGWTDDANYCSLATIKAQLASILKAYPHVKLVFRPHPFTGRNLKSVANDLREVVRYFKAMGHEVQLNGSESLYGAFNKVDLLLSDVSSVVSDFLASGKPILLTNPGGLGVEEYQHRFPVVRGCYLLAPDASDLVAQIAEAVGSDPKRMARYAISKHILGGHAGRALERFKEAVSRLYQQALTDFPIKQSDEEDGWIEELKRDNETRLRTKTKGTVSEDGTLWVEAPHGFVGPNSIAPPCFVEVLKVGLPRLSVGTQLGLVEGQIYEVESARYYTGLSQYRVTLKAPMELIRQSYSVSVRICSDQTESEQPATSLVATARV